MRSFCRWGTRARCSGILFDASKWLVCHSRFSMRWDGSVGGLATLTCKESRVQRLHNLIKKATPRRDYGNAETNAALIWPAGPMPRRLSMITVFSFLECQDRQSMLVGKPCPSVSRVEQVPVCLSGLKALCHLGAIVHDQEVPHALLRLWSS